MLECISLNYQLEHEYFIYIFVLNKMSLAQFEMFLCVSPYSTAVEALHILLARAHLDVVEKVLDQGAVWDKMKDPQQHTTGVTLLSRYVALKPL